MAAIAATRQEVSDRFEILGFTINTGNRPYFEVVVVSDLSVLGDKSLRNASNFWASGALPAERGEAVFLVPPDVLRRFAGQPRLWYGYATFADKNRSQAEVVMVPSASSPWVSLSAYTGRSRRRAMTLRPDRRAAAGNYGAQKPGELEWAGDNAGQPASDPRSAAPFPAKSPKGNGNGNSAPATSGNGTKKNGNGAAPSNQPAAAQGRRGNYGVAYDDGFGPLPTETAEEGEDDYAISGPINDGDPMYTAQGFGASRAFTETPEYPAAGSFVPARHFTRPSSPRTISRIVIHITDGQGKAQGTADYFRDPQQWLRIDEENGELQVEREGDVIKRFRTRNKWKDCVDGKTKAQGNRTVGLARVGASAHYVVGQEGEIIQMVRHADIAWHAGTANNDTIGIEHNARTPGTFGKNDAGLMPNDTQYQCSARLVCWLAQQFGIPKDRTHILGHAEADPNTTHTMCPNSVWDWDKYMQFVTDGSCDPVTDAASQSLEAEIPLDPGTGGMSIAEDALEVGDIIVATTDDPVSLGIRVATGAPVSHAMIFTGDGGQVVEAIGQGVVFRPLAEAIASATVAVAFRKPNLTEEQRLRIRDFVGQQIDRGYNYWGIVRQAKFMINSSVCDLLPDEAKERCRSFYGRVYMGSGSNDTFFCSELAVAAYAAAGVPITNTPANWTTPGGIADLTLSGELAYVGHLKAPPLASGQAFARASGSGARNYRAAPRAAALAGSRLQIPAVTRVAQRLRRQGVNAMALDAFCTRLTAPALSFPRRQQRYTRPFDATEAPARVPITLPSVKSIEGWQAELLLTALEAVMAPYGAGWAVPALRLTANTANVSIGIGPALTGGLLGGAGLGTGVVFAPNNVFGIYGATELSAGLIASISDNVQLTVIGGGLEKFGGEGYAVGFAAGEGFVGGAALLLTSEGAFSGVSGQVGAGVGLSPVDIYLAAQRTQTSTLGFSRSRSFNTSADGTFPPEAIERMRQEIVNAVSSGTETSLTQLGLRRLYNGALRNSDGSDKPSGGTVSETVARLTENQRVGPAQPFEFIDESGQTTLGLQRPQQLRESIEAWLLSVAQKSTGWRVFLLSLLDGYHSAIITVENHTNGEVGFRLFWADQIYSGWDDVSGTLDARVTERTQGWWDPLPADQKARTRATLWPLIPAAMTAPVVAAQSRRSRALGEIEPDYSGVSDFAGAVGVFASWLKRRLEFTVGVPNTTFFPHSAICKIRATDAGGTVLGEGTGFYIGRTTIMTAGHVVDGAAGVEVTPAMNGADTMPFSGASVPGPFRFPAGYRGAQDNTTERDVALIDGAPEAPNGQFFEMEELRMSPQTGIIVCGYAATGAGVDPDRQHMDVDCVRELHNGTFTYGLETRPGTSGGPVFYTPDESTVRVVGVHVSGFDNRSNKGVRLTDALIANT